MSYPNDAAFPDANRQRLLDQLLSRKLTGALRAAPWPTAGTRVPLSPGQAGLWFLEHIHPGTPLYNVATALCVDAWIEFTAVQRAFRILVERHDALRLCIVEESNEPVQEVSEDVSPPVYLFDFRNLPIDEAEAHAEEAVRKAAETAFRLSEAPLFRVSLILFPDQRSRLIIVFHHVVIDGWSIGILFEEFAAVMAGAVLPPTPGRYLDYVAWQRTAGFEVLLGPQLAYWRRKLSGTLPVLDLPSDWPRPATPSSGGRLLPFTLPNAALIRLRQIVNEEAATPFIGLLTVYKVLLHRLSGSLDVIVGAPFAGREQPATARIVGFFANSVVLRTDLSGDPSFRQLLRRVRATTLEAQEHQSLPFERLVEELRIPREMGRHPVFQTMFALQNTPRSNLRIGGVETREIQIDTGSSKFDLTLSLTESDQGIDGVAEYSTDIFKEATVCRYIDAFLALLEGLCACPDRPIRCAALLSAREKSSILFDLNPQRAATRPRYRTLSEPFEEQVASNPDAIALISEDESVSYVQLNARSDQLARRLIQSGVRSGDFVAICADRGISMVVAIYAVAKAGAAYVPIDPELPEKRLSFMLEDCGARLVIVDVRGAGALPSGPWTVVDLSLESSAAPSDRDIPNPGSARRSAYLLYTSGSTGRPKGVAFPIDSSVAFLLEMCARYAVGPGDAVLLKTPFGFDVSVWELFWPLYSGAKLVVCRPGGHRDSKYLADQIRQHRVTAVNFVPSMLQTFLEEADVENCRSLRLVLCAGEALPSSLRNQVHRQLQARLVNLYGPTETGAVTDHVFDQAEESSVVPIGKPLPHVRLYILDDELEPTLFGVPGELYVGGELGLAHGYHGQPELTAERFIPNPYALRAGERLYRTGDICRYLPDGAIEYIGRLDGQIKLRGVRLDPGEIEAVLHEHAVVATCAVLAAGEWAETELVAFVVLREEIADARRELLEYMRRYLPPSLVPSKIISLSKLPTTFNGKLDRSALLEAWRAHAVLHHQARPVADDLEHHLAFLFGQILGASEVGVDESFFDLGGHSLLVLKLASACEQSFGIRPAVAQIFATPTVRGLARVLRSPSRKEGSCLVPLAPAERKPVLILVHAASGSALPYQRLAQLLCCDFSVYGLQSPSIECDEPPPSSVEEFARRYLDETAEIAERNPIMLAGWSFGGNIAFELARLLRSRGTQVLGIFLIDSWVGKERSPSYGSPVEAANALETLQHAGLVQADMPLDDLERTQRVLHASVLAFRKYYPRPYQGPVDLLYTTGATLHDFAGEQAYVKSDRGWSPAAKDLALHPVPGEHFKLMSRGQVEAVADVIRASCKARLRNLHRTNS